MALQSNQAAPQLMAEVQMAEGFVIGVSLTEEKMEKVRLSQKEILTVGRYNKVLYSIFRFVLDGMIL